MFSLTSGKIPTRMAVKTVNPDPWRTSGDDKREAVQSMFAEIAPSYDFANSLMSLRFHHRWRAFAVAQLGLRGGESVLDMCCGTGDFLPPLRRAVGSTGRVTGVDFCAPMLERAGAKTDASLVLGDGCALPFQSGQFDAVTVGWGIRNVPDIDAAHREICRVLKPGGRFVSVDMAVPESAFVRPFARFVSLRLLPICGAMLGHKQAYTYLPQSTETFLSRQELAESMQRAGFDQVRYHDLFIGTICVHVGQKS